MKTATDTRLLFNRFSLQMLRNPVWLFVGFSTPILYLVLFTPLLDDLSKGRQFGGTSVLDVFLPGILALLAFASGSASGFSTIFELQSGVIERFRVTPASRFAILMGPILSGLVMMMAAFSIATALITKDISSFAAVINGINLPVLLLAGVLLPISLGPLWMRVLAHFNPLYYLVEASRELATGSFGSPAVWQAFAILVPLCALVLVWATRVFQRAVA